MSGLARRTLRTSVTAAGVAALGVGFVGTAFAAPSLPEAPELPAPQTPELAAPDLAAPDLSTLGAPAAPELPAVFDVPGVFHFDMPNVTTENNADPSVASDAAAGTTPTSVRTGLPTEAPQLPAEAPALPEPAAAPQVPVAGELATPFASVPLADSALPEAPQLPFAAPELPALPADAAELPLELPAAGPELPQAPALPALPATSGQDVDTTQAQTAPSALSTPGVSDLASQIAALAG